MRIKESDVGNVSFSLGFGFEPKEGVKEWMEENNISSYPDYVKKFIGVDRDELRKQVEDFVFSQV